MHDTEMKSAEVNLVVAHGLEAKALIKGLELKPIEQESSYPLYRNSHGLSLIVSGMGQSKAAEATAYLASRHENKAGFSEQQGWLNIGIAGHKTLELGAGLLAHKITSNRKQSSFYPPMLLNGFISGDVITVDDVEHDYPELAAYEMEAYGFYQCASRFSSSELVQVFKIISDNQQNPVKELELSQVPNWIEAQLPTIKSLIRKLQALVLEHNLAYRIPSEVELLYSSVKLTATQRSQVKRLCQRYYALDLKSRLQLFVTGDYQSGRQLVKEMESELNSV